jgi:ATP-dependent DNA ligase
MTGPGKKSREVLNTNTFRNCSADFLHIWNMIDGRIEKRKTQLEELLKTPPGVIRYSVSFTKDIEALLGRARELGLEGLIGKRAGSRYEAGKRTGAWIKLKLHLVQEFVMGGYTDPESGRKYYGSLLVGFYEASAKWLLEAGFSSHLDGR